MHYADRNWIAEMLDRRANEHPGYRRLFNRRFRALGLRCPSDVSVVGHNDMPYVDMLSPPLTTVRIAQREMGSQAAQILLEQIANPGAAHRHIMLRPELIVRGSTASPPPET